jgi:hypothetical protein
MVELKDGREDNHYQASVDIEQELDEELSVVEANTIVDPWAMVVHVENATVADTAMMCTVGLPNIAHFTIPPSLSLITHVKAPIWRHHTWICHDALIERSNQIEEEHVIQKKEQDDIEAPKLRSPDKADV